MGPEPTRLPPTAPLAFQSSPLCQHGQMSQNQHSEMGLHMHLPSLGLLQEPRVPPSCSPTSPHCARLRPPEDPWALPRKPMRGPPMPSPPTPPPLARGPARPHLLSKMVSWRHTAEDPKKPKTTPRPARVGLVATEGEGQDEESYPRAEWTTGAPPPPIGTHAPGDTWFRGSGTMMSTLHTPPGKCRLRCQTGTGDRTFASGPAWASSSRALQRG